MYKLLSYYRLHLDWSRLKKKLLENSVKRGKSRLSRFDALLLEDIRNQGQYRDI